MQAHFGNITPLSEVTASIYRAGGESFVVIDVVEDAGSVVHLEFNADSAVALDDLAKAVTKARRFLRKVV